MQPDQIPQPQYQPPVAVNQQTSFNKRRKMWGIICLVGPTALILLVTALYAVVNLVLGSAAPEPSDGQLFAQSSPLLSVVNILLFLVGAIVTLTWLPGIIVGIVLLATKKR